MNPLRFACRLVNQGPVFVSRDEGRTPGCRALLDSCIRTLIVSAAVLAPDCDCHFSMSTNLGDGTQELPSFQLHLQLFNCEQQSF
jgi:hypothetical protein